MAIFMSRPVVSRTSSLIINHLMKAILINIQDNKKTINTFQNVLIKKGFFFFSLKTPLILFIRLNISTLSYFVTKTLLHFFVGSVC